MSFLRTAAAAALACAAFTPFAATVQAETLRLPSSRDTWLSNAGDESKTSSGASPRMKLKSIQELSIVDFDVTALRGKTVRSAALHVKLSAEPRLHRVTVGTIAVDWVEGAQASYGEEAGTSTYLHRKAPDQPWSYPGSDLTSVILGQGGTRWSSVDASEPDKDRWQTIAVSPDVIGARVAETSFGFVLFDDTGSEWTRQGEKFTYQLFPNRYIYSRDQNSASAPYLTVEVGDVDTQPPSAVTNLQQQKLPATHSGEAVICWSAATDSGAGVVGYRVTVDGKDAPNYLVPTARDGVLHMHLRDMPLPAGKQVSAQVRAVDGAGNVGPPATVSVQTSDVQPYTLHGEAPKPPSGAAADFAAKQPHLGKVTVAVVDPLDKQSAGGKLLPAAQPGYLGVNHLWNVADPKVTLHAGRNELVGFQVLLDGSADGLTAQVSIDGAGFTSELSELHHVDTPAGPMPDPMTPLTGPLGKSSATHRAIYVELYVPRDAKAGDHTGELTLTLGPEKLSLPIALHVWNFTLPDRLSFLPEMNCYDLPDNERDYYQLAQRNRVVLNRVPYFQNGRVAEGCAPVIGGDGQLDWTAWDKRFAPLLDGSLFAGSPRGKTPVECFYLPLHENWPTPIEGNYDGGYWADKSLSKKYRERLVDVTRQFAAHFAERGWDTTLFHAFLNGKVDFKKNGWSRGTSPWLLDEPANFQDYWALEYFAIAFHEGKRKAGGDARIVFRADISRPQWQRDLLDDTLDYNVVSGDAFLAYHRLMMDRQRDLGEIIVVYGGTNDPAQSNVQPVAWSLDVWSRGGNGVLPWQTVGNAESWKKADALSLFYPGESAPSAGGPKPGVCASIRLKAYLRGQQDAEYLTLLARAEKQSPAAVGEAVRAALTLSGKKQGTGFAGEDAGVMDYGAITPTQLWRLRMQVAARLDALAPPAEATLVDFNTPPREPRQH